MGRSQSMKLCTYFYKPDVDPIRYIHVAVLWNNIYLYLCHSVTHEPENVSVILLSVTAFQVHCLTCYHVTLRLLLFKNTFLTLWATSIMSMDLVYVSQQIFDTVGGTALDFTFIILRGHMLFSKMYWQMDQHATYWSLCVRLVNVCDKLEKLRPSIGKIGV